MTRANTLFFCVAGSSSGKEAVLQAKNQLAGKVADTNLALKLGEADTQNKLALKRADVLGNLAERRFMAGLAESTRAAFA